MDFRVVRVFEGLINSGEAVGFEQVVPGSLVKPTTRLAVAPPCGRRANDERSPQLRLGDGLDNQLATGLQELLDVLQGGVEIRCRE